MGQIKTHRDHGGRIGAAIAKWGGAATDWIDLSTGINPVAYPIPSIDHHLWTQLPDQSLFDDLENAARNLWQISPDFSIVFANGASALIAAIPGLLQGSHANIPEPTYNEHRAAFTAQGWAVNTDKTADVRVLVHPNNPTGHWYRPNDLSQTQNVIDESFGDIAPDQSLLPHASPAQDIVLKSFGKFWGLAGARLGVAIVPHHLAQPLADRLGPWAVSGPTLAIAAHAWRDTDWANQTRARLSNDSKHLDEILSNLGAKALGGTDLFRLYHVDNAATWHEKFAQNHILTRIFPYSDNWIRLGLPAPEHWTRLETLSL